MGKVARAEFEGETYTLSLISWNFFRRLAQGKSARVIMRVPFVPRYELAVWKGPTLQGAMDPDLVSYFPDKQAAIDAMGRIHAAIAQGGIFGQPLLELLRNSDPQRLCVANFCDVAVAIEAREEANLYRAILQEVEKNEAPIEATLKRCSS